MKKTYFRFGILCMILFLSCSIKAQTIYDNQATTIEWAFNGTIDEPTTSPTDAVSLASFSYGDGIVTASSASWNGISYTRFQPTSQTSGASTANALSWKVKPTKGLTFTPTKVSGNIRRFGTDGGLMNISAINNEGKSVTLGTAIIPARNKSLADDATSGEANFRESFSYDIPSTLATTEGFTLVINVYNLGNTKQVGFNDIKIEGTSKGTTQNVTKYTFAANCNPADAATISVNPNGTEFESGTELTVKAERNFGYKFINWTDGNGKIVSTNPDMNYTLSSNTVLTANLEKVNTYCLNYTIEGGANDYMVQTDIEPTIIDNKKMFEEGSIVSLSAASNDILTFLNWDNGETSPDISVKMDGDKNYTAFYSKDDYIAAWDFYLEGNDGRKADFASADNDADALVLRDEAGNAYSWLDKSNSKGQYEGRDAGVNWKNDAAIGTYYWQTKVNASSFTNIKVKSGMAYNYNAYTTYNVEYSLDGTSWNKLGAITMPGAKEWVDSTFNVPAEANNKAELYIRWIADKSSAIDGTTSSNDGNAISQIYITGTEALVNDGTAPVLVNSIPSDGGENASANGQMVLTFDEKVKLTDNAYATIGDEVLTGNVSGKTLTFIYNNLDYSTDYTFTLKGGSVADLCNNTVTNAISISFKTKVKPAIEKALYDFIVPTDGTFKEAVAAAAARSNTSQRFRIFVKKGTYDLPTDDTYSVVGSDGVTYPSSTTFISSSNLSIIGEDIDKTIIRNVVPKVLSSGSNPIEGIGNGDVIQLSGSNTYLQDITIKNGMADATGRNIAIQDKGNKTIYKNVMLYGYQDTWVSNNQKARYYFEGGVIRGRTDYTCGKGDAFFNGVTFKNADTGGYISVPSVPKQYGYIMSNCVIKSEKSSNNGNYSLGRPWGSGTPIALWINTEMVTQPTASGWSEMSGGWPARYAEYNSYTSNGTTISLSSRKSTFGDGHTNNPVLTASEAAKYTIPNVMGQDDGWDPTAYTEQASAPENVTLCNTTLSWDDSNYALLWAIEKDGSVIDFTTTNSYTVTDASASYAVRAANEMGGLSEKTNATIVSGISSVSEDSKNSKSTTYDITGRKQGDNYKGIVIVNGKKFIKK